MNVMTRVLYTVYILKSFSMLQFSLSGPNFPNVSPCFSCIPGSLIHLHTSPADKWQSEASCPQRTIGSVQNLGIRYIFEGSLEVKLPTIWTDEKQSREEAERRERLEERRVEEKE